MLKRRLSVFSIDLIIDRGDSRLAAADEVDDFYFVGFGDGGFRPVFSAHDIVIEFDRDAAAGELKVFEEFFYIDVFRDGSLFAVHNDLHRYIIYAERRTKLTVVNGAAEFDLFAFVNNAYKKCGAAGLESRYLKINFC